MHLFSRQAGDLGIADGRHRLVGLVVHQINGGQLGRDLRLGDAVQALVDLIGQQIGGRSEQVHRHQPVGHAADHFIAVRPDRGEVEIVVEQRQRIHRLHLVGAALEEEVDEGAAHIVLRHPCRVLALETLSRDPQGLQALAPLAMAEIERSQLAQGLELQPIAAPAETQSFQLLDGLRRGDGAGIQSRDGVMENRLRSQSFVAALLHRDEVLGGGGITILPREQTRLRQFHGQRLFGIKLLGHAIERGIGKIKTAKAQCGFGIGDGRGRLPVSGIAPHHRTGLLQMGVCVFPILGLGLDQPAPESGMTVGVKA